MACCSARSEITVVTFGDGCEACHFEQVTYLWYAQKSVQMKKAAEAAAEESRLKIEALRAELQSATLREPQVPTTRVPAACAQGYNADMRLIGLG